jgi:hypothetical protein
MRVIILLLALVATPVVAGVSQDLHPRGKPVNPQMAHCDRRSERADAQRLGKDNCPLPAPAPGPVVVVGSSISGRVYDNTGSWPYPALAGLEVSLSGPVNTTARTDREGNYVFTGLPAGDYTICPPQVSGGWTQSFPSYYTGASCVTGIGYVFPITEGVSAGWNDFGFRQ